LIQYRSVTDTQPASQPPSQPRCRSYYAQRSGVEPKNSSWMFLSVPPKEVGPLYILESHKLTLNRAEIWISFRQ